MVEHNVAVSSVFSATIVLIENDVLYDCRDVIVLFLLVFLYGKFTVDRFGRACDAYLMPVHVAFSVLFFRWKNLIFIKRKIYAFGSVAISMSMCLYPCVLDYGSIVFCHCPEPYVRT